MPSAFPMLCRSAARQWAGLEEAERVRLNGYWSQERLPEATFLRVLPRGPAPVEHPIWLAAMPESWLTLISVKLDWVSSVP